MTTQSLEGWLASQDAATDISYTVLAIAAACTEIATAVHHAPLNDHLGEAEQTNVQGEVQKTLDIICNDVMVQHLQIPPVSALVSEEIDHVIPVTKGADLVVCFDPLDGSSNVETNGTIGTIFSVLKVKGEATADTICAASHQHVAAGYVLYGPATLLVLTTGKSVAKFALDGTFQLVKSDITIPTTSNEFAINMAYRDRWDERTSLYIENCLLGKNGPRGKSFNMRWMGAMVADIHRIFMRGGIFLYPTLSSPDGPQGKLRLLYEINPLGWMIEIAGGKSIGQGNPDTVHQRAPFIAGSADEVEVYLE